MDPISSKLSKLQHLFSYVDLILIFFSAIILAFNICTFKQNAKPSVLNYLKYVAYRWLSYSRRLIGPIFLVYLMPLFGDGPIWHYYEQIYSNPCKHNLLPSFLFYSNYVDSLDEVVSGFKT